MNYLRTYIKIIKKARMESRFKGDGTYYELHHIKPKSLYPTVSKAEWNLVLLTAREHYICHWLLAKALGKGMWHAFWAMNQQISNRSRYHSSLGYKICKENYAKHMQSDLNPSKINPFHKDRPKSEEHKKKLSEAQLNKPLEECPHCKRMFRKSSLGKHLAGSRCTVRDGYIKENVGIGRGKYKRTSSHSQEYRDAQSLKMKEIWKKRKQNGEI